MFENGSYDAQDKVRTVYLQNSSSILLSYLGTLTTMVLPPSVSVWLYEETSLKNRWYSVQE